MFFFFSSGMTIRANVLIFFLGILTSGIVPNLSPEYRCTLIL